MIKYLKQIISITIFCILFQPIAMAQQESNKGKFNIGFNGGVQFTNVKDKTTLNPTSRKTGFVLGPYAEYFVSDVVSVKLGLNYDRRGYKIDDLYVVLSLAKNADNAHIYSITRVIIPTILKTMETIESPHLPIQSSQKQLVVDTLTGFFAGDSVQIDTEILNDWTQNNDPRARVKAAITGEPEIQEEINQVHIETYDGNAAVCKVKEVDDKNVKGKNMIRIPEKLAKSLEITKGDLVLVKPAV